MTSPATTGWGLVVPLKLLTAAKTRLAPYGDRARAELALAFADDLLVAALSCPAVERALVVSDDVRAEGLARTGAEVVADVPGGLNAAFAHGAALLQAGHPHLSVAAVAADLPALREGDLADVLALAAFRSFVADADGVGTTLLAVPPGEPLRPAYGPGSRAAHLASGARELPAGDSVRRDVDTPQDLQAAVALGVGRRTAAVLRELAQDGRRELAATVASADAAGGAVVLDDGRRLAYVGDAVQPEVRRLRPGQRVRLQVSGEPPQVRALTLAGLPLAPPA